MLRQITGEERKKVYALEPAAPRESMWTWGCGGLLTLPFVVLGAVAGFVWAGRQECNLSLTGVTYFGLPLSLWGAIAGAAVVQLWFIAAERRTHRRSPYRAHLRNGMVEELHFTALAAVRVVVERFTSGYVLAVGDDRLLCVDDGWLEPLSLEQVPPFPGRRITLVRFPDHGPVITLALSGPPLPPARVYPLDPEREQFPLAVTLLPGTLEELDRLFLRTRHGTNATAG